MTGDQLARCIRCGRRRDHREMEGFAGAYLCNGVWDRGPTCYEQAQWEATLARAARKRRAALGQAR